MTTALRGHGPLSVVLACIAGSLCLGVCPLSAQSYPAKTVRIVVPTSAGGGNDFVARLAGQRLGERLG